MIDDRNYYRACSTRLLTETARYSGSELAVALGERLEEYDTDAETITNLLKENAELERRLADLREELNALHAQLGIN